MDLILTMALQAGTLHWNQGSECAWGPQWLEAKCGFKPRQPDSGQRGPWGAPWDPGEREASAIRLGWGPRVCPFEKPPRDSAALVLEICSLYMAPGVTTGLTPLLSCGLRKGTGWIKPLPLKFSCTYFVWTSYTVISTEYKLYKELC